jgi:superfamily II DNA/RNA helicase
VLVKRFLSNPLTHSVDSAESPVAAMTHHVLNVATPDAKTEVVHHLASGTGRRLLFMRTKHQAKRLARQLTLAGIPAVDLHGNLSQNARQRNLEAFSSGQARVLVATDIAARGIHVDDVELVVHVDPPTEHKAYLHRSGRTARAGSGGDVVTVVLPEETGDVRTLMRQARISAAQHQVTAASPVVAQLTGEVAAFVEPVAAQPVPAARPAQGGRSGSPRGTAPRGGGGRGAQARSDAPRSGGARPGGSRTGGSGGGGRGARTGGGGRSGGLVYSSTSGAPSTASVGRHPGQGRSTRG